MSEQILEVLEKAGLAISLFAVVVIVGGFILASVIIAKGYRQIEKVAPVLSKGNMDSAVNHLNKALNDFGTAVDHAANAVDDACTKAAKSRKAMMSCRSGSMPMRTATLK